MTFQNFRLIKASVEVSQISRRRVRSRAMVRQPGETENDPCQAGTNSIALRRGVVPSDSISLEDSDCSDAPKPHDFRRP